MALVSISEAAKLVGIARSQLYSQYIKRGTISITRDAHNKPTIDVSELIRVFGGLHGVHRTVAKAIIQDSPKKAPELSKTEATQAAMIELLKEQLAEAKARENFYQQQLTELTQAIKLLEHKPTSEPCKWWQVWK